MHKFIPIHEYIKEIGQSKQNVYRWIREHKFEAEDIKVEEILVKRIRIREGAKPKMSKII